MARIDPGDMAKGLTAEGSGRVDTYLSHGLIHSYTLECNYNTGRVGNEVPPTLEEENHNNIVTANTTTAAVYTGNPEKYTPASYASVGRACVIAMLDLRGMNKSSRIPKSKYKTLERLRQFVAAEVRGRREYRNQTQSSGCSAGGIQQLCRDKRSSSAKNSQKDAGYGVIPWRRIASDFGSHSGSADSNTTTPSPIDCELDFNGVKNGEPATVTMINFTSIADSYPAGSSGKSCSSEPAPSRLSKVSVLKSASMSSRSSRKSAVRRPQTEKIVQQSPVGDVLDDQSVVALDGSEQAAQATSRQVEPKLFSFPTENSNSSGGRPKPGGIRFKPLSMGQSMEFSPQMGVSECGPAYGHSVNDKVDGHSTSLPPKAPGTQPAGKIFTVDGEEVTKSLRAAGAALLLAQTMQGKQMTSSNSNLTNLCRKMKLHGSGRSQEEWTVVLTEEQAKQECQRQEREELYVSDNGGDDPNT